MPRPVLIDITGQRFGRLLVIEQYKHDASRRTYWVCQCDCGEKAYVQSYKLRNGVTKSCGCIQKEKRAKYLERITKTNQYHYDFFKKKRKISK